MMFGERAAVKQNSRTAISQAITFSNMGFFTGTSHFHRDAVQAADGAAISWALGDPPDRLPQQGLVIRVLVSEMVVAGLDINQSGAFESACPGHNLVAGGFVRGEQ